MTPATDHLAAAAPSLNIALVTREVEAATFDVPVDAPSGRQQVFRVRTDARRVPSVREVDGALPSFCPQRHINPDGSFCLGWGEDAPPEVVDEQTAEAWWGRVLAFLRLQMRAQRARKWTGPEWAHGSAAVYQLAAERAAAGLGEDVLDDLRAKRICVEWLRRRTPIGGRILRMTRKGRDWYMVWDRASRVVNKQQPCVCSSGSVRHHRRLRNCGDHAQHAYDLAKALLLWSEAEKQFWEMFKGAQCCGTIEDCPLRSQGVGG